MNFSDFLYFLVIRLIHGYKWVELQILKLFSGLVTSHIVVSMGQIGIVVELHDPASARVNVLGRNTSKTLTSLSLRVNDVSYFPICANQGPMGIGKGYMDGLWDCEDMVELSRRFLRSRSFLLYLNPWNRFLIYLEFSLFNMQTRAKAWEVAQKHYDLGNDLYESFLDPQMQYTCAYWARATNLNEAQVHKMELIASKLNLRPGMRVLDIGCGWGTLCKYLAENYGVECVGVSISGEGVRYGQETNLGLPVNIRLCDYRDVVNEKKFDRIVSIGMFEHVGTPNYNGFFEVVHRCLKEDGIFLLQCIGLSNPELLRADPWLSTYIFPNGRIPFDTDIINSITGKFVLEDWHNFGPDYAKTLAAWSENFNRNWDSISRKYGERFNRMWNYYLDQCQGVFLSRTAHLWQVVLSKNGLEGDYRAAR